MNDEKPRKGAVERFEPELKLLGSLIPLIGEALATYVEDVVKRRQRQGAEVVRIFEESTGPSYSRTRSSGQSR